MNNMNNRSLYLLVVIASVSAAKSSDDYDDDEIDPDQIIFTISNSSHAITVTWRTPDNVDPLCLQIEVQYKNQCVKDWKRGGRIELEKYKMDNLNLTTLSMKTNYDFRIRMRYQCIQKGWSNWTRVQSWGYNADACMVKLSSYIWVYSLIIVLPLTSFLIVCLLSQQGIRKMFLPDVPDPKRLKKKIMDIDQPLWFEDLTQKNEECTTTVIEIIDKSEIEEQHQTLVIQPIDTLPEQHDSVYCIYSPETSGGNTELQYSRGVLGYIVL